MRRRTLIAAVMLASAALVGTAVAQGMASVTIGVNIAGTDVDGKIEIKDENGTVVAEGPAGETLAVPPGRYTISITCEALVDTPTYVNRGFEIVGGQSYECNKRFMAAEVTLNTRRGGRAIRGDITLRRQGGGEPVAKVRSGRPFKISPGRYDGIFKQGRNQFEITGLQFMDGATQQVPVNFN